MMKLSLQKGELSDAEFIHDMKVKAFMPLLNKYQDFETSPANEPIERVITQLEQSFTDYYIIQVDDKAVGAVRIVTRDQPVYRVSPIFVLPEHQGKGIAQNVFMLIEEIYTEAEAWELATILEEKRNCYLYEKIGYSQTGVTNVINDKMTIVAYRKTC